MSCTEHVLVAGDSQGERLDRWLASQRPELSRSRLQKLIEAGHVYLNGQICQQKKTVVQAGDRIVLKVPATEPLAIEPTALPLDILYEDDAVIVLNKAAGMVVHPAPGHYKETLVNALLAHCEDLAGIGGVSRPGIVHRLDKDTSGAIVVAKTDQAMLSLQAQIQAKTAQREYLAVIYGVPAAATGIIDQPIGRHRLDRKRMAVVPEAQGGRRAVTHWHLQERLGPYSLIHFRLETGRTHQIRVHTAFIGHPIVGDRTYSSGRSMGVNLPGQALHAWRLTFQHPETEQTIEAIAPLPVYFETLLAVLRRRLR